MIKLSFQPIDDPVYTRNSWGGGYGRFPRMAVPRIDGSKKAEKACYLFHDSINPENSALKKYK